MSTRTRIKLVAACAAIGYSIAHTSLATTLAALAILAGAIGYHQWTRTAGRIGRFAWWSHRNHGVASTWSLFRHASSRSVRRKARVVRPSLNALSRVGRARMHTREVGVKLCRVGWFVTWTSTENHVLALGGTRSGKTAWLGGAIIDAPGAAIITSTRTDLYLATRLLRSAGGRPVWVYNPAGLAGIDSTLTFSPLHGCTDPQAATRRADDMIPASTGDGARWDSQARRILAVLLHAAALLAEEAPDTISMRIIAEWIADPDEAGNEIISALRRSPDPTLVEHARAFIAMNTKSRSSVTLSVSPALEWLSSPDAVAATAGDNHLDVAALLRDRGTIYLLGRHEAHTGPLLAALTGHIAREARRIAAHQPGGRLDPGLTLGLDECSRIAPVNLPDWSGDFGGAGINLLMVAQSKADLVDRWGVSGAAKIGNNAGTCLLWGGITDADELASWSKLSGERLEKVASYNPDGTLSGHSTRRVPVLSVDQLSEPGEGRVVMFHRNTAPVIGRTTLWWRRNDVRDTRRWRWVGARYVAWRTPAHQPGDASTPDTPARPPGGHQATPAGAPAHQAGAPTTPAPAPAHQVAADDQP